MAERYMHLEGNLYFDTQDRVIVRSMGTRFVYVRHDRRTRSASVGVERRSDAKASKNLIQLDRGLLFDRVTKQIYKVIGGKRVLYSKDRRKERKQVTKERRKS